MQTPRCAKHRLVVRNLCGLAQVFLGSRGAIEESIQDNG
jgi:hypothetical protein